METDGMPMKLLLCDLRANLPLYGQQFRCSLAQWRNRLLADFSKLLVLGLCVWGGYLVLLTYLRSIWSVFAETPMGVIFATRVSPEIVVALTSVFDLELSQVARDCVLNILLVTLPAGVVLKFSGLYRLTYVNRGLAGGLFWGTVCAVACARYFPLVKRAGFLQGNGALYFLPAVCLVAGGFALAARLAPEFTVVFRLFDFLRERSRIIKIRDLPHEYREP